MIREDYRARISREFLAIQNMEVYEQTFPIYLPKEWSGSIRAWDTRSICRMVR
mgnify:FL=1